MSEKMSEKISENVSDNTSENTSENWKTFSKTVKTTDISNNKSYQWFTLVEPLPQTDEMPWCTCNVYYYSPFSLAPQPIGYVCVTTNTHCIKCHKPYKRFYVEK